MTGGQLLVVALAGALTYVIRSSFLAFAGKLAEVPPVAREVLRMIPPAALAALTVPALLRPDAAFEPVSSLVAGGIAAALVAWWRRDLFSPLVVGLVVVIATRPFLG